MKLNPVLGYANDDKKKFQSVLKSCFNYYNTTSFVTTEQRVENVKNLPNHCFLFLIFLYFCFEIQLFYYKKPYYEKKIMIPF